MVLYDPKPTNPSVLHMTIAHVAKPTATNAHTHTQYLIRVSDERSPGLHWTVYRRYSEFRVFRMKLEEAVKRGDMCAHCMIMSKRTCFVQFPHRRWFGNLKESTLEKRRLGLNMFLDAVAKHARTCKESMTCQTRPLMDQFLMVSDMRYTYLNVNMSEQEDDFITKSFSSHEQHVPATPGSTRSLPGRLERLSAATDFLDGVNRSSTNNQQEHQKGPVEDQKSVKTEQATQQQQQQNKQNRDSSDDKRVEGRVLKAKLKTMPNLLDYNRVERKSRTNSWNDDISTRPHSFVEQHAPRPSSITDWELAKSQFSTHHNRHSDPGVSDLLSFSRGSFSRGSFSTHGGQRRSDRVRKVHLSSAAKRVKKLEEQEARFTCQQQQRQPKRVSALPTIMEE